MKYLTLPLLSLLLSVTTGWTELVENGNFSKDVNHWKIGRHQHYGPKTTANVKKGELSLSRLLTTKPGYFSISQAVLVQKDKQYKMTYEVKGPSGQQYSVSVGDYKSKKTASKKMTLKSASWGKGVHLFKAKSSTEAAWHKAWHKAHRKNGIEDGRTPYVGKKIEAKTPKIGSETSLKFGIGGIEGHFAIRNVSLVEVK